MITQKKYFLSRLNKAILLYVEKYDPLRRDFLLNNKITEKNIAEHTFSNINKISSFY